MLAQLKMLLVALFTGRWNYAKTMVVAIITVPVIVFAFLISLFFK